MDHIRPLVRWTVGPCSPEGQDSLCLSIRLWRRIFGDRFRLCVCYNSIGPQFLARLRLPGVELIDQKLHLDALPLPPAGPAWKLYPPRLNLKGYEIFIDNDLIVYRGLPILESFLNGSGVSIFSEGLKRCFGSYDGLVPENVKINTGFFGLAPGFDFGQEIRKVLKRCPATRWRSHFDEQGLVSAILWNTPHSMIPLSDIYVCFDEFKAAACGLHFAGLNSGNPRYWHRYAQLRLL